MLRLGRSVRHLRSLHRHTMNYDESIAYLYGLAMVGMKLGLKRIRVLLEALGSPGKRFLPVLIAGTNGKGSVAAMIHAAFREAGLRTGLYTSPHMRYFEERIVVDGSPMPREEVCRYTERMRQLIRELVDEGKLDSHPTYFEVVTAMALSHFADQGVTVAALEVGLGGRFDATNAVDPAVSVITRIALDHTHYLGDTLREVAFEKAGIIRPRGVVVTSCGDDEPLAVIRDVAGRSGADLRIALEKCRFSGVSQEEDGLLFDLETDRDSYPRLRLALHGEHQLENAAAAVLALEALAELGVPVTGQHIRAGLTRVRWPGRLELVPGTPPLLLDCAHNPDGARALARYLAQHDTRPVTLLFGVMEDKNVEEMTAALFPRAESVVVTRPGYRRSMEPADVAAAGGSHAREILLEADPARALDFARDRAGPDGLVVAAGSLFLISDLKQVLDDDDTMGARTYEMEK